MMTAMVEDVCLTNTKLASFTPTSESFEMQADRAHFQATVWKSVLDPVHISPTQFGYSLYGGIADT